MKFPTLFPQKRRRKLSEKTTNHKKTVLRRCNLLFKTFKLFFRKLPTLSKIWDWRDRKNILFTSVWLSEYDSLNFENKANILQVFLRNLALSDVLLCYKLFFSNFSFIRFVFLFWKQNCWKTRGLSPQVTAVYLWISQE